MVRGLGMADEISRLHTMIRQAGGPIKVAKATGVSNQTVFAWIHQGYIHQAKHAVVLAEMLGIGVSPLLRELSGLPAIEKSAAA